MHNRRNSRHTTSRLARLSLPVITGVGENKSSRELNKEVQRSRPEARVLCGSTYLLALRSSTASGPVGEHSIGWGQGKKSDERCFAGAPATEL